MNSVIAEAELDQLITWWSDLKSAPVGFTEEEVLDEIAYALSKHRQEGVDVLRRSLNDGDRGRRKAALSFLATQGLADNGVHSSLLDAYASVDFEMRYTAIWGFIRSAYFPLTESQVSECLSSSNDRLAALGIVYQCHACPENRIALLRTALQSSNPRSREYACDEIGDLALGELAAEMRVLLQDSDANVALAAECNLAFFE